MPPTIAHATTNGAFWVKYEEKIKIKWKEQL
jgi:hypothetical protein